MPDIRSLHNALLLWGCVFNVVGAVCMLVLRNFDRDKRRWMIGILFSTAILLGSDFLVWTFDGAPGQTAYYIVRITNFLVFFFTLATLAAFNGLVSFYIYPDKEQHQTKWTMLVFVVCGIGMLMVVLSQFFDLYYDFDSSNVYYRKPVYPISVVLPVLAMAMDLVLLIRNKQRLKPWLFYAMVSYIVLPSLATGIQMIFYGYSLIDLAVAVVTLIMLESVVVDQNQELGRLEESRNRTSQQLEIATTLNRCVTELSAENNIDQAVKNLLPVINGYFDGDRTYIFRIHQDTNTLELVCEYVSHPGEQDRDCFPHMTVEDIHQWMVYFQRGEPYLSADPEKEEAQASKMLEERQVGRLLSVPLRENGRVIGFLGVDNPQAHYDDPTLLSSIQFFIMNSFTAKKQREKLELLSYRDVLTNLNNRNQYVKLLERQDGVVLENVGVAYLDINGLKKVNDSYGHEAGDRLIRKTAAVLLHLFSESAYRIGGDEFVIFCPGIGEGEFQSEIQLLRKDIEKKNVSVSVGAIWRPRTDDLEELLKEADRQMYQEKDRYYSTGHRGEEYIQ